MLAGRQAVRDLRRAQVVNVNDRSAEQSFSAHEDVLADGYFDKHGLAHLAIAALAIEIDL